MELVAFLVLSLLAIVSALVVVTHRNPVVAALALAGNLLAIAGFFLLLGAQFVALLQVIVYAGAIMVLILFVIMLLNLAEELRGHASGPIQRVLGPVFALLFVGVLGRAVASLPRGALSPLEPGYGTVEALGRELFGRFFYPFEVISLLLVTAMVGAVLLAKRRL